MLNLGFLVGWIVAMAIAYGLAVMIDGGIVFNILLGFICTTVIAFPVSFWYERKF